MATDSLLPGSAIRAHGSAVSPAAPLLRAQQDSLDRDERIATLELSAVNDKAAEFDIVSNLLAAHVTLTMEGASTLRLTVHDPERRIERSQLLDRDRNGRLDDVACTVDHLRWRLAGASRPENSTSIDLVFEDEVWALLRAHNKPKAVSRNSVTRAQFIESLVREIKLRDVPFFAPEKGRKQPKELPELPEATPPKDQTGFDKGASFTIKGIKANPQQKREVATAMTVADQLDVPLEGVVRLAMLCAGIGESSFIAQMNQAGSAYGGVFQGNIRAGVFKLTDTEGMARCFLKGGKGYQAGGAIAAHRNNPGWSPGEIALNVEGSRSNFGSYAAAVKFYQDHIGEARKIQGLWGGSDGTNGATGTHEVVRVKSYRFTRGLPGQRENSAQAAARLADEVQWRFFIVGGVAYFVTDEFLLTRAADHVIEGYDAPGLLGWPGYQWDHRKLAADVTLPVVANAWSVRPGSIVALRDMGSPLNGRWIVETFEFDLLNPLQGEVTLTKPIKAKKEPAPEIFTVTKDDSDPGDDKADEPSDIDDEGGPSSGKGLYPPVKGVTSDSWGYHPGVHDGMDLICPAKATLYACCRARVIDARSGGWWGKSPSGNISLGDGIIQLEALESVGPLKKGMHIGYGHAESPRVKVGETVDPGDPIGHAGFAVAWHVHFMINGGGTTSGIGDRDPRPYWNAMKARKGS